MKKSLLALAVLGAFTGVASAQSSVTLFGVVDLAARSVINKTAAGSDSNHYLAADGNSTSRLGFRGTEDLGDGLKAGFWLEGALTPDDGTAAGQNWKRRSTVSLVSQSLGELRLGRDYAPTFWNHTNYDPFGTNGVGSHNNMVNVATSTATATAAIKAGTQTTTEANTSGLGNFARNDNSIGYFLPSLGPVSGQLQFALPEDAAGGKGQYIGGRIVYAIGALSLAGQAGSTHTASSQVTEHSGGVAGSYDFGAVKLMAQWNRYTVQNDSKADDTTTKTDSSKVPVPNSRLTNYLIGAIVPVNAKLSLKASYNSTTAKRTADVTAAGFAGVTKDVNGKQFAVGAVYDLSKRTALYTTYSRINNGTNGTYTVASTALPISAGKSSSGYEFGLRHSF